VITLERNLEVFNAHCLTNGHNFEAYDLPSFLYGERIIRSSNGEEMGLVICYEDPVFKEVKEILDSMFGDSVEEAKQINRFNVVFGLACDPLNGKELDAAVGIVCPVCKSTDTRFWEYEPPQHKKFLLPLIQHQQWLSMNIEERKKLIRDRLKRKSLL
jgi:hypothetical protein